jgi:L-asparaginase II
MPYTEVEARQQLLDELAEATDALGQALASLGDAYEQLDEQQADRLEEQLFRPVQRAYARARRTYSEFASRYGLSDREFAMASAGLPSSGVKGFVQHAVDSVERADHELVALQESSIAIEVGDPEFRSGLAEVRTLIAAVSQRAREFLRSFGR